MSISDFDILSKVGEGVYSTVWKVKRKSDGFEYAMKRIKLGGLSSKEKENVLNEIRILASIDHPHIVSYKDTFLDDESNLCIIMEYAAGGDIANKIESHSKRKSLIPESLIWKYFAQMVMGLKGLHERKILHRDLKPANVFLSKDSQTLKIGDLNVAKVLKARIARTQVGTPYYMSPEVWSDQPYDSKCDIWSLGCVIYEMCALKPPFRANDFGGLYKKIMRGSYERIPNTYSTELAEVISYCLKVNPILRPNCDQLLKMPPIERKVKEIMESSLEVKGDRGNLLETIKVPKNIRKLRSQLPKPKYHETKSLGCLEQVENSPLEGDSLLLGCRPRLMQVLPNDIINQSNCVDKQTPREISMIKESPEPKIRHKCAPLRRDKSFESKAENSPDIRIKRPPPVILRIKPEGTKGIRSVEPVENKINESLPVIQLRRFSKDVDRIEPLRVAFPKQDNSMNKGQADLQKIVIKVIEQNKPVSAKVERKNLPRRIEPPRVRPTPDRERLRESYSQIVIRHDRPPNQAFRKIDLNLNRDINRYEIIEESGHANNRGSEVREKVKIKPIWWG